jgi:hypothetical protein
MGGRTVEMPFWKDLTATRQLLSDSGTLTVNKIAADKDIARIHNDAQAWSVNHLAKVISGDDPMQAIVDLVADYWARTDGGLIVSCLKGIFAAASMAGNKLTIASETVAGQSSSTRHHHDLHASAAVQSAQDNRKYSMTDARSGPHGWRDSRMDWRCQRPDAVFRGPPKSTRRRRVLPASSVIRASSR